MASRTRSIAGSKRTTTERDGHFTLEGVLPRTVRVTHPSYLASERPVPAGAGGMMPTVTLPPVTLLGGDLDQDGRIYTRDVVILGGGWNQTPGGPRWREALDITDDDVVNVLDAVAIQFNFGQTAPGLWPDMPAAAARGASSISAPALADTSTSASAKGEQAAGAAPEAILTAAHGRAAETSIRLMPEQARSPGRGVPVMLDIQVADVARLFGYTVVVRFDPAMLRVRDANPRASAPGVQVRVGEFLDPANLLVARNQAHNDRSIIELTVSQTYPATGRNGSGVLALIGFDVLAQGTSRVKFEVAELYDDTWPDPVRIPATPYGADVTVASDRHLVLVPMLFKGWILKGH